MAPTAPNELSSNEQYFRLYAVQGSDGLYGMTGVQWAKFCREHGLTGGAWTTPKVDITFTKNKTRGQRKLTYRQFIAAQQSMHGVTKRSSDKVTLVNRPQPSARASVPLVFVHQELSEEEDMGSECSFEENMPQVFNRLTDPRGFTGASRLRFDKTGRGRGIEGRQYQRGCNDESGAYNIRTSLAQITDRSPADVRGVPLPPGSPPSHRGFADCGPEPRLPQVYRCLTDTKTFTGLHRHRFGPSGEGLGASGRDHFPGRDVVGTGGQGYVFHSLAAVTQRGPCDIRGVPLLS